MIVQLILVYFNSFLYWSDWGDHAGGIHRSGMDGSLRILLVSDRITWPNSISIDHTTNRLYWVDVKTNIIEYITLDGRSRKVKSFEVIKILTIVVN